MEFPTLIALLILGCLLLVIWLLAYTLGKGVIILSYGTTTSFKLIVTVILTSIAATLTYGIFKGAKCLYNNE